MTRRPHWAWASGPSLYTVDPSPCPRPALPSSSPRGLGIAWVLQGQVSLGSPLLQRQCPVLSSISPSTEKSTTNKCWNEPPTRTLLDDGVSWIGQQVTDSGEKTSHGASASGEAHLFAEGPGTRPTGRRQVLPMTGLLPATPRGTWRLHPLLLCHMLGEVGGGVQGGRGPEETTGKGRGPRPPHFLLPWEASAVTRGPVRSLPVLEGWGV